MSLFSKLGLNTEIVKALNDLGFETPTPIQEKTIPYILSSTNDLKAFAQTGTGKTAAFGLPIVEQIDETNKNTQALIISPTRELAIQIAKNIREYTKYLPNIKTVPVYGGENIDVQIRALKKGSQIVVGTPGRTVDLLNRKRLNISSIKWLTLDEADEMLNMGFKEELDQILDKTPSDKQTLLFSATFPREVDLIARKYLHNPKEISAGKVNSVAQNIEHHYYLISERNRYNALKRIADINTDIYGIVFCRTRRETKEIADKLIADGYSADALHGDLSQSQRDSVMKNFRSKNLQILVATDVAARGLDVNDLTHIIHYKLPDQSEAYTHRSGRTGRAGKKGISIALITDREQSRLRPIERKIGQKFVKKQIPSGKEICERQLFKLIDKIENIEVNNSQINEYLEVVYDKLSWLDREELIKRFVSVEFSRFLDYYQNAPDLNKITSSKQKNYDDENFTRFFINLGKIDKLTPPRLMGLINENLSKPNVEIGQIDILDNFSFFELDKAFESELLTAFEGVEFNGRRVSVEITKKPKFNSRRRGSGGGFDSKRKPRKEFGRKRDNDSYNFSKKRRSKR